MGEGSAGAAWGRAIRLRAAEVFWDLFALGGWGLGAVGKCDDCADAGGVGSVETGFDLEFGETIAGAEVQPAFEDKGEEQCAQAETGGQGELDQLIANLDELGLFGGVFGFFLGVGADDGRRIADDGMAKGGLLHPVETDRHLGAELFELFGCDGLGRCLDV